MVKGLQSFAIHFLVEGQIQEEEGCINLRHGCRNYCQQVGRFLPPLRQ